MPGFLGWLEAPAGRVPCISGRLTLTDHLGACKARWGIGRMSFIVPPGLYALGRPDADAPVIVTANYKMTYDLVRQALAGRSVWLLVLETYGINVWCAAGKGTFGTGEVVRRVVATRLGEVVRHRQLILPLLGAPGVAAYQVAARCGFQVAYATIRASDLPAYLDNGCVATPAMRELTFSLYDRLVLVPVEIVLELKSLGIISALALLVSLAGGSLSAGLLILAGYAAALLSGTVLGPLLLPWLPGRSFAVKGAFTGLATASLFQRVAGSDWPLPVILAVYLLLPAISAFYTLNFTGCTPFTSRSGVKKEMRLGLPVLAATVLCGLVLLGAGLFFKVQ